jgi:hypothetical protein
MAKYKALINTGYGINKGDVFEDERLSPYLITVLLKKGRIKLVKEDSKEKAPEEKPVSLPVDETPKKRRRATKKGSGL